MWLLNIGLFGDLVIWLLGFLVSGVFVELSNDLLYGYCVVWLLGDWIVWLFGYLVIGLLVIGLLVNLVIG